MSSPTSLPPTLDKMVQRFKRATEPKRRYEQLLYLAQKLDDFPADAKIPENKVQGCVSQVYITATLEDGKIQFQGDSDAQLTKGLLAFLIEGINGITPGEVIQLAPDFIAETGLAASLTPSRANGFYNIFKTMQQKALILSGEVRSSDRIN
ncbi:MAG: SufE family protein [Geitlerinemataceae cyanobacterium]